eukprot:5001555-Amphidinium_carterae.1
MSTLFGKLVRQHQTFGIDGCRVVEFCLQLPLHLQRFVYAQGAASNKKLQLMGNKVPREYPRKLALREVWHVMQSVLMLCSLHS